MRQSHYTNFAMQYAALLLCIREIPCSDLSPEAFYIELCFSWFLSVPPRKDLDTRPRPVRLHFPQFIYSLITLPCNPGWLSRHSDWLWAGLPRCRCSSPDRAKIFLLYTSSRPALGFTQPHIQWLPEALSLRLKRPGRVTDHSPPTSAEVKNAGSIHPHPHTSSWRSA
jgi:hypothetical protein